MTRQRRDVIYYPSTRNGPSWSLRDWLEEQTDVSKVYDASAHESARERVLRVYQSLRQWDVAWKSSFAIKGSGSASRAQSDHSHEKTFPELNDVEAKQSLNKESNTDLVSKSPPALGDSAPPSASRSLPKVKSIDGLNVDLPELNPNEPKCSNEEKQHQDAHTLLCAFRSVFSDHPNFAEHLVSTFQSLPAGHQQSLLGIPLYCTDPCQLKYTTQHRTTASSGSSQNAQSESTRSCATLAQNCNQVGSRSSVAFRKHFDEASDKGDGQDGKRQKPPSREKVPDGGENSYKRRYACPFYFAYPEISAIDPSRFSNCDQPKADENRFRGRSELKKHLESQHRRAEDQASPGDRFFISNDGRWVRIAGLFESAPKTRPRQGREDHDLAFYINMWDLIGFPPHIPTPTSPYYSDSHEFSQALQARCAGITAFITEQARNTNANGSGLQLTPDEIVQRSLAVVLESLPGMASAALALRPSAFSSVPTSSQPPQTLPVRWEIAPPIESGQRGSSWQVYHMVCPHCEQARSITSQGSCYECTARIVQGWLRERDGEQE